MIRGLVYARSSGCHYPYSGATLRLVQLLAAVNPRIRGSKMRSSEICMSAWHSSLSTGDKREGKIIVIDGSLTQINCLRLPYKSINRVVSGSALFRDDRLVGRIREPEGDV